MRPDVLAIDDLAAGYGAAVVLRGLSLRLAEGRSLAVLAEGAPEAIARDPRVREAYLGEPAHG